MPSNAVPFGNIQKNTDLGFVQLYRGDKASAEKAFTAGRTELEGLRTANVDNADLDAVRSTSMILPENANWIEASEQARQAAAELPVVYVVPN